MRGVSKHAIFPTTKTETQYDGWMDGVDVPVFYQGSARELGWRPLAASSPYVFFQDVERAVDVAVPKRAKTYVVETTSHTVGPLAIVLGTPQFLVTPSAKLGCPKLVHHVDSEVAPQKPLQAAGRGGREVSEGRTSRCIAKCDDRPPGKFLDDFFLCLLFLDIRGPPEMADPPSPMKPQ